MGAYILRRVLWTIPVFLLVMLLTFVLMRGAGGSPFRLESGGLPVSLQGQLSEYYNLDEPWPVEFATYVKHIVTLDFGPSLVDRYGSVDEVVKGASRSRLSSRSSPRSGRCPSGSCLD